MREAAVALPTRPVPPKMTTFLVPALPPSALQTTRTRFFCTQAVSLRLTHALSAVTRCELASMTYVSRTVQRDCPMFQLEARRTPQAPMDRAKHIDDTSYLSASSLCKREGPHMPCGHMRSLPPHCSLPVVPSAWQRYWLLLWMVSLFDHSGHVSRGYWLSRDLGSVMFEGTHFGATMPDIVALECYGLQ